MTLMPADCTDQQRQDLKQVERNGYALQYVKEQTPEICLAAVKQDGYALQYVSKFISAVEGGDRHAEIF